MTKITLDAERLIIAEFTMDIAEAIHLNSPNEGNRLFVPDKVFETAGETAQNKSSIKVMECGIFALQLEELGP